MNAAELKPIIESMIFVADEPMTESGIMLALAETGIEKTIVREAILLIEKEWNEDTNRGIGIVQVAGGYQFRTKPQMAEWLKRLSVPKPMRLSGPALETLAIVAYRQPIVRSEVEKIRGVDSGAVLKTLLDRHIVRIVGRRDEPGQPLLYGTTKDFLEIFNLKALTELPTLKDIEELMRERRVMTENKEPAGVQLPLVPNIEEEEEPTEVIVDEEEEPTEVIKKPPDEIVPVKEDEKDMEALCDLENSLKSLRRLERSIFPKDFIEKLDKDGEAKEGANASGTDEISKETFEVPHGTEALTTEGGTATDEACANAPAENDSPFE